VVGQLKDIALLATPAKVGGQINAALQPIPAKAGIQVKILFLWHHQPRLRFIM
jgi:hypothetical protein